MGMLGDERDAALADVKEAAIDYEMVDGAIDGNAASVDVDVEVVDGDGGVGCDFEGGVDAGQGRSELMAVSIKRKRFVDYDRFTGAGIFEKLDSRAGLSGCNSFFQAGEISAVDFCDVGGAGRGSGKRENRKANSKNSEKILSEFFHMETSLYLTFNVSLIIL